MKEKLLITLSAYADGELDGRARTEFEAQLAANADLRAELHALKQLDAAAAKLPVPECAAKLQSLLNAAELRAACDVPLSPELLPELQRVPAVAPERFAQLWTSIAARTVALEQSDAMRASALADGELADATLSAKPELAAEIALWKRLDAAAANLAVPALPDLAAREAAGEIAARIRDTQRARFALSAGAEVQTAVPQVSPEKWDGVWKKIESKVSARNTVPEAVTPGNVVPLPRRKASRWRWIAGATAVAAVVLVALLLKIYAPVETSADDGAALDLPKSVNERYDITVEYVKGDPVVCYYLKPEAQASDNRDWRWLPD